MKKRKLIKITKYLSKNKTKNSNSKSEVSIEENEENVKVYFVKHLVE